MLLALLGVGLLVFAEARDGGVEASVRELDLASLG
jgi:hypothetical protein